MYFKYLFILIYQITIDQKMIENHSNSQHSNNSDRITEIGNNQNIISRKEKFSLYFQPPQMVLWKLCKSNL